MRGLGPMKNNRSFRRKGHNGREVRVAMLSQCSGVDKERGRRLFRNHGKGNGQKGGGARDSWKDRTHRGKSLVRVGENLLRNAWRKASGMSLGGGENGEGSRGRKEEY